MPSKFSNGIDITDDALMRWGSTSTPDFMMKWDNASTRIEFLSSTSGLLGHIDGGGTGRTFTWNGPFVAEGISATGGFSYGDDVRLDFGAGNDIGIKWDSGSTRLEFLDASSNVFGHITDDGTEGTFSWLGPFASSGAGTFSSGVTVDKTLTASSAFSAAAASTFSNSLTVTKTLTASSGAVVGADLQVNGTNIGLSSDTDLISMANGALTVNGTLGCGAITSTGALICATNIGIAADTDLIGLASGALTVNGALTATGNITNDTGVMFFQETITPTPVVNYGALYTKTDNALYFQDGAGTEKLVNFGAGGGDVSLTGTPVNDQLAVWTDGTTIEGDSGLTFAGTTLTCATFAGALTGNADTVTTNANLTGPVTSSGNATTLKVEIGIACSDELNLLGTGTAVTTFRMPYAMTVTGVRASVNTAPTGSTIIVDINDGGSTIMTTNKLSIDATEKTSETAATAPGITDTALADDAEITIDIDQVGSTIEGKGLKVWIIGTRAA